MNLLDHLGLREDEDLRAVLQQKRMFRESGPFVIFLGRLIGIDHRAHRAVEDENPLGKNLFEINAVRVDAARHGIVLHLDDAWWGEGSEFKKMAGRKFR